MQERNANIPTIYPPKEVAELLRVTSETVCSWIRSGRLKAIGLGTDRHGRPCAPYGIRSDDLLDFLGDRVPGQGAGPKPIAKVARRTRRAAEPKRRKLVEA